MAAIIHPSPERPAQAPLVRPGLRLARVPRAQPSAAVFQRRRLVVGSLVALVVLAIALSVAWFALQAYAPTPPPLPHPAAFIAPA